MARWQHTSRILYKYRPQLFNYNYNTGYKNFFPRRILEDRYHPLYKACLRTLNAREETGLRWNVTIGAISKSRVVRNWVCRRLRNAFIQGLKERGIAENGLILKEPNIDGLQRTPMIQELLDKGASVSLRGSLKLHAMPPSIAAEKKDIRKETGMIIDLLLKGLEADLQESLRPRQRWQSSFGKLSQNAALDRRIPRAAPKAGKTEKRRVLAYN